MLRRLFPVLTLFTFLLFVTWPHASVRADIFISNYGTGTVRQYANNGTLINATLISGIPNPAGITVSGTNLFVATDSTVRLYNTSGTLINVNLITGLATPHDILATATDLYVTEDGSTRIGKYSIGGGTYNPNFITGFTAPTALAISGNTLFVGSGGGGIGLGKFDATTGAAITNPLIPASYPTGMSSAAVIGTNLYLANNASDPGHGLIAEYDFSGNAIVNPLISNLNVPWGLANAGNNVLLETNFFGNTVGAYTFTGAVINTSFITGLSSPTGIAVTNTPEPASLSLLVLAGGVMLWRRRSRVA